MIIIEQPTKYTPDDARDLGALKPYLDDGAPATPVDETKLRHIIESPNYTLFIARDNTTGRIVGTATLTYVESALTPAKGWLEDFVTHGEYQGHGVGGVLWTAIEAWCHERQISLNFTSNPTRVGAHRFYHKHGAEIRNTAVFHKDLSEE